MWAGSGIAAVLVFGLLCVGTRGFPQRFPARAQEYANARFDMSFINELTRKDVDTDNLAQIGVANPKQRPEVLVWGDSHAMAVMPAIDAFLKEKGLAGRAATHSGTPPVMDWLSSQATANPDSINFNNSVFSYVRDQKIPVVILTACWGCHTGLDPVSAKTFNSALLETVRRLTALGSQVWLLLDVPNPFFDVPRALSHSVIAGTNVDELCIKPTAATEFDQLDSNTIVGIKNIGGRIMDPKPQFLDPTGQRYIVQEGETVLYRDGSHLTTKGAKLILLPLLRDSLTIER